VRATIDGVEYLDVKEAARLADYSDEHVRRLARQGKVDSVKQGNMVFLSVESLTAYIDRMKELGTEKHSPWRD